MTVRLADQRVVTLPQDYLEAGHVTHSYAITGHKAQGMTTDRAFVLGDESLYREWGYVAMSRGREENRLYVVMGDGCGRDDVGGAVDRPYEVDQLVRALERSKAKSLALDPEHAIAALDTASLRAQQRQIFERLCAGPRDREQELSQLREEAESAYDSLQGERHIAAEGERRLASMGAIAKARRKWEVQNLRHRIKYAGIAEQRLSEKLQKLAAEEKEIVRAQRDRDRWMKEQRSLVERGQAIEGELAHRNRELLRIRETDLPKYLEDSLGPVPERPSEKSEWRRSVLAIEDYREMWGINDRKRALGGEPRRVEQRREKERIERDIENRNDRRLGRSRDDDFGIERSVELSL